MKYKAEAVAPRESGHQEYILSALVTVILIMSSKLARTTKQAHVTAIKLQDLCTKKIWFTFMFCIVKQLLHEYRFYII